MTGRLGREQGLSITSFAILLAASVGLRAAQATELCDVPAECLRRAELGSRSFAECVYNKLRGRPESAISVLAPRGLDQTSLPPWHVVFAGRLLLRSEETEAARVAFDRACEEFTNQGDRQGLMECLVGRLDSYVAEGDNSLAQRELFRIKDFVDESSIPEEEARYLLEAAYSLKKLGRLAEADRSLSQLSILERPDGTSYCDSRCWFQRGSVAMGLGRWERAVDHFKESIDGLRSAGDSRNVSNAYFNMAMSRTYFASISSVDPGPSRARLAEEFDGVFDAAVTADNQMTATRALFHGGKLRSGEGAIERLGKCLSIAAKEKFEKLQISCLQARALRIMEADLGLARDYFYSARKRIDLAANSGNAQYVVGFSSDSIVGSWELLSRDEALEVSLEWLDVIEQVGGLNASSAARAQYFDVWSDTHSAVAGRLLQAEEPKPSSWVGLAHVLQERMRARELANALLGYEDAPRAESTEGLDQGRVVASALERLLGSEVDGPAVAEADDLRERIRVLDSEIVELNQQLLAPEIAADERTALEARLRKLELDRSFAHEAMVRSSAAGGGQRTEHATLEQVAAALGPGEGLLSYQLAFDEDIYSDFAGSSWVLVVTRDGTEVVHLGDGRPLMRAAEDFLGQLGDRRRRRRTVAGADRLHADLVASALAALPAGIERLTVVPDGILHLLPFALLRDAEGRTMADRFTLEVVPSASLWMRWRTMPRPAADGSALVLADPVTRNTAATTASGPTLRGVHDEAGNLPPLPAARREGEAVVAHLPGDGFLLVGADASERALKDSDLSRYRVLHVAAHAIVDEDNPDRSSVFLAAGAAGEDGLLQMREIVDLDLAGRLVVLSACSSARGTVLRGEGVMSLARAFFAAGAPAVVGSLWPLADEPAKELFDAFYRHLGAGWSVADALRAAQRERAAAGASVEDWASVAVFGDGSLAPFPRRGPAAWHLAVAALVLLTAIAILLAAARRRWGRRGA